MNRFKLSQIFNSFGRLLNETAVVSIKFTAHTSEWQLVVNSFLVFNTQPVDVLPKNTCLAKALQNCGTIADSILALYFRRLSIWTSDLTDPVLRA